MSSLNTYQIEGALDTIKVIVIDDHPVFCRGLCDLLNKEDGIECVATISDAEKAIQLLGQIQTDVAIIDVAMPKIGGIQLVGRLKKICPTCAVIMMSAYDYESYILTSLRAGAVGYLLKTMDPAQIGEAIRSAYAGQPVFEPKAIKKILMNLSREGSTNTTCLNLFTKREAEVLKLIAKGFHNIEIADKLTISQSTVQTHLESLFRKLNVNSRTGALLRVLQDGWLTLDEIN